MSSWSWNLWLTKSGCEKRSRRQQQSAHPGGQRKLEHYVMSLSAGHKPCSRMICSIPLNQPGMKGWSSGSKMTRHCHSKADHIACAAHPGGVPSPSSALCRWKWEEIKWENGQTFRHFPCRDRIRSSFLMAWCIIEKEKGLGFPFGQAFEDVNSWIDLHKEFFGTEIPVTVLASLEDNPSLPENKSEIKGAKK